MDGSMKITKVKFYDSGMKENSNYLSKCSVVLDDCFVLNDIKLLNGKKGMYIIMPKKAQFDNKSMRSLNNKGEDVFHPVEKSYFSYMSEVILMAYNEFIENGCNVFHPR